MRTLFLFFLISFIRRNSNMYLLLLKFAKEASLFLALLLVKSFYSYRFYLLFLCWAILRNTEF